MSTYFIHFPEIFPIKRFFLFLIVTILFACLGAMPTFAQERAMIGGVDTVEAQTSIEALPMDETGPVIAPVSDEPVMYVFHSTTCPHCAALMKFLDSTIVPKYPQLEIRRYEVSEAHSRALLRDLALQHNVEQYKSVPLVFVGDDFMMGYNTDKTSGVELERKVRKVLGVSTEEDLAEAKKGETIKVALLGEVDPSKYSLAALAILLGTFDGFNVCSLGALMLIIGLTLKLQRRRAIVLFGGAFILTTAVVYGGLIVLWAQFFDLLAGYINGLKVAIALLSIAGGGYFLKEYLRMRGQGAVCTFQESTWITKVTERTGKAFENATRLVSVLGSVVVFAAVVAIVEFPCSAAVPLVFAGMLADAGVSTVAHMAYIGLFVLFYMLDELIIFGLAAYRLKLWMMNGTFTKWAVLGEALILLSIGLLYLGTFLGLV
ncbi:MAG: hypothetical protein KBD21_03140 [Candidatus Pacebacteria bacterium]|nr:hypothetical protein [Candidatus Paceibacterota bacterium]